MSSLAKRTPMDGRAGQARWAEAGQARRIRSALRRQRARRRDLTAHARRLASGQCEGGPAPAPLGGLSAAPSASAASASTEQYFTLLERDPAQHPPAAHPQRAPRRHRGGKRRGAARRNAERQLYADQLAHHEWMVHIPRCLAGKQTARLKGTTGQHGDADHADHAGSAGSAGSAVDAEGEEEEEEDEDLGWFVAPRPEGRRCLVIAAGGRTIVRDKNGSVMATFQSTLPNGARSGGGGRGNNAHSFGDGGSILDCILQEREQPPEEEDEGDTSMSDGAVLDGGHTPPAVVRTYWVLDVMCWKGYSLYDCDASFRAYWLDTKLSELALGGSKAARGRNLPRFLAVPRFDCDADGLARAYDARNFEFQMDGLLFMNRAGHYAPGPDPTPLTLVWKDAACAAPYFTAHYRDAAAAAAAAAVSGGGGGGGGGVENALCGLLEGLNVHSSESVLLRVSKDGSEREGGEGGAGADLHPCDTPPPRQTPSLLPCS